MYELWYAPTKFCLGTYREYDCAMDAVVDVLLRADRPLIGDFVLLLAPWPERAVIASGDDLFDLALSWFRSIGDSSPGDDQKSRSPSSEASVEGQEVGGAKNRLSERRGGDAPAGLANLRETRLGTL